MSVIKLTLSAVLASTLIPSFPRSNLLRDIQVGTVHASNVVRAPSLVIKLTSPTVLTSASIPSFPPSDLLKASR